MGRLKIAATAAGLLGGLALTSAAHAFTFLVLDSKGGLWNYNSVGGGISGLTISGTTNALEGLGQLGTTVYGESGTELYKLAEVGTTVTETAIGASGLSGVSFVDFGSTTGALYAIGSNGDLYTINTATGAATLDGSGLGIGTFTTHGTTAGNYLGLSTGGSSLLFTDGGTIYSINTTTGIASKLGTTSGVPTTYGALMFATAAETGSAATAGLYGGSNMSEAHSSHTGLIKFTISGTQPAQNFAATVVATTTPNNSHADAFWGMAPGFGAKVMPEPSEWALMLVGVGAVGGALRVRRRKAIAEA
jgi:hypothetical protein